MFCVVISLYARTRCCAIWLLDKEHAFLIALLLAQHRLLAVVVVANIATAVREHLLGPRYLAPCTSYPCAVLYAVTAFDVNLYHLFCPPCF